jgi:hypothetical protein
VSTEPRRFPPPWSVDDPDTKLGQSCFIVRDKNGQALTTVYFEDERRRKGVSIAVEAEFVVDPYIDHLKVAILTGKLIAGGQARESGHGNSKGLTA